jgi:hypothetical protein
MQAVSRVSGHHGRQFRYVCGMYWNRGASICSNGLMARMELADAAVRRNSRKSCSRSCALPSR